MDRTCCEYVFAGTSEELADDIPRLKERFPKIDVRLIDADPEQKEIVPRCHLAIVTLDFTTEATAIRALSFARACLMPDGVLVVIGLHPARWVDFVFGAHHRHPHPSDNGPWRPSQRPALFWQQQLHQQHFSQIELLELSPDTLAGPYMLLTQPASEVVPAVPSHSTLPRSWVLLADPDGLSAQLSDHLTKRLQTRGDLVVQSSVDSSQQLQALLGETTASYGQLDGIVYLAGIANSSASMDSEGVVERQVTRCAMAASILQACEITQTTTTCWMVTAGVGRNRLPRSPEEPAAVALLPGDAALWGFGRTLMNEATTVSVRLVDLDHAIAIETATTALEREFEQPDGEQEILLTRRGARYVPRLDLVPRPDRTMQPQQQVESPILTLGFPLPGKLRSLRWEARPGRPLTDHDIEVAVQATGLNFRDLMYTLGLLSSESLEYGFAGPTLGLEFSGIVQNVGRKACPFKPGDRVVGFGPSSFSNRVITQTSAITHLPAGISFEAAATIPCTFFTVYYALHHLARLQPGETVLIHCAAGGVGIAAIQLAKWLGAEIFVTAGSDEKRDFLHLLGVDQIFDSRSLAFADQILARTEGKGVDVVLNSLSGDAIDRNFRVLKPFGRFLELGKRDYYENTKIGLRPFRNNISYFGIDTDQLMQARPDLARTLFTEVMDLFTEGVLHPLPYHLFEAEEILDAFRYMQQARHIGKIVVTYRNGINQVCPPGDAVREPLQLAADAAYLVTGGLGGFGLRTAQWLVEKGARHLLLISRSGPSSEEAHSALNQMRKQGVTVLAASCDVTDKKALATLLAERAGAMPPLKGIVHAATVINDGLIRTMDADQIRSVLEPKALGAYHLHELTCEMPLDFFVLFSSATTLFGNPGQGNYVAANACLEGLARNRRAAGLPATCVRWGAIDDVGFLARNKKIKDALHNRMGGAALHSTEALAILEGMLVADRSGLGVVELDWSALSRFLPSAGSPRFSGLTRHAGESSRSEERGATIQRMLEEFSEADFLRACVTMLQQEVGEILRIAPEKIDPSSSLYDMGLDSLMGVELIGALESLFGVRLPPMLLSQSPTLDKLAEHLLQQLKGSDEEQGVVEEQELLRQQVQQLAQQHGAEVTAESLTQLTGQIQTPDPATILPIIK
jgi:NADPH:quinone reductase-like Zn-dependent oxidoreductase/acyl carrier protein